MYQSSMNIDTEAKALLRQAIAAAEKGDRYGAAAVLVDIDAASWEAVSGQPVASIESTARIALKAALAAARDGDTYHVPYHLIDVDPLSAEGFTARLTGVGLDPDELLCGESLDFWTHDQQPEALLA